jgi:hypothetical protein
MECPFHFYCICMLRELILSFVYGKISQTDNLIGGTVRLKNINVQLSIVDVQQIIRIALDEKPQEALAFIKENLFKTEKQTPDLTFIYQMIGIFYPYYIVQERLLTPINF